MTTKKPLVIGPNGAPTEISSGDKLGGFTGGTASGEAITQDQLDTNYNKLGAAGSPVFAAIYAGASGIFLEDILGGHFLNLVSGESLTSDAMLTIVLNNVSRNLTLFGDVSFSGSVSTIGGHSLSLNLSGVTSVTLPTSGTLATQAYVDNAVTGLFDLKGSTNCSGNPNYPAAFKGDAYVVSTAGKIGGASGISVDVGDVYIASADNAGGTQAAVGTSWFIMEKNLQGALLSANNLSDVANVAIARTNIGAASLAANAFTGVQTLSPNGTAIKQTISDTGAVASWTTYVNSVGTFRVGIQSDGPGQLGSISNFHVYLITNSTTVAYLDKAGGFGYPTGFGIGGTVTQTTSKSTGVTLSKSSGDITLHNAALGNDNIVSFVLTNTRIAAGDVLILNHVSGGTPGKYSLNARCGAGSATIDVTNISQGSLSEAIVIKFVLIKATTN